MSTPPQQMIWGNRTLSFERTLIMGVLNVTPDSFSDGGLFTEPAVAQRHVDQMIADGADIIDVGGESSRPGAESISEKEELQRVLPIIAALAKKSSVPISIDTTKPAVADACIRAGASIINDITGLQNEEMIAVAVNHDVPVVLMHMQGTPRSMQTNPSYTNVVNDITAFFRKQVAHARQKGVRNIILDPGIGFGKTTYHNLEIIRNLAAFETLGCPLLLGPSRKKFLGDITGLSVDQRDEATLAALSIGIMHGANIIRVHDVKGAKRAAMVANAIKSAAD